MTVFKKYLLQAIIWRCDICWIHSWSYLCHSCDACDQPLNTLRPRQNGHYFPHDIFKCIFLNKHVWILLKIPLKFVPEVQIKNIPELIQIMAWHWPGDKPLSEPMTASLLRPICVTQPQWVKFRYHICTWLILGLHPANERCHYKVTLSLTGWAQI